MNGFWDKLRDFAGFNEESDEYYGYDDEMDEDDYENGYEQDYPQKTSTEERPNRPSYQQRQTVGKEVGMPQTTRNNVIGMPGMNNGISEVMVFEPHTFEEMPQVIQALRERKSVVLNLNVMEPEEAQRAVDFIAGGTYAIDGHQERIGESIFLFTPSCVQVSTPTGVAHEVKPPAKSPSRTVAPNPNWGVESSRMAQ